MAAKQQNQGVVTRLEAYVVSVIRGRRGLIPGIIRGVLAVMAVFYTAGLKSYLLLYRIGVRRAGKLPCAVVCVGNLTTGGTGKTPTTQMVCRMLQAQGKRVAVIIRGYGGEYEHGCALASDGDRVLLTARQAGDEAYLLARTLPGIAVAVGRDRLRTGRLVYAECRPDVIVMDDGMQHWRLYRDLDIVLLNACQPFDNGWTVPRGMLREPKRHLRRAGVILLTNTRRAEKAVIDGLRIEVAKYAPGRPIFDGDLYPQALLDLKGREAEKLAWLDGRRVGAMCALGNPASFESLLGEQGAIVVRKFRFRDHHQVTIEELEQVVLAAESVRAAAIVTTEKDAVKLPLIRSTLPVIVLQAAMKVRDEAAFLAAVIPFVDGFPSPSSNSSTIKLS